jgi:hypothetical protein
MADGLLEVRRFDGAEFEHTMTKDAATKFLDIMTLYVHSGKDQSALVPDYMRYHSPSSPSRTVRHHMALHHFIAR